MVQDVRKKYSLSEIVPGMILAKSILTDSGKVILGEGVVLTQQLIDRLKQMRISHVVVQDEQSATLPLVQSYLLESGFVASYNKTIQELKAVFQAARFESEVNLSDIWDVIDRFVLGLIVGGKAIAHIHNMPRSEEYLLHHSLNVGILSGILGKWLGYSDKELTYLILTGLIHDIGKTRVPAEVLDKPRKLSPEEMEIIKLHTVKGYNMVKAARTLNKDVLCGVLQHHERNDGTGYPLGIPGERIHNFAKIIAIADVYDAVTSDRVYGKKRTPFAVIEILVDEMVNKLDINFCTVFLMQIRDSFNGNIVLLSDDRKAEIVYLPPKLKALPVVRTEDGEFIDLEKCRDIAMMSILTN